MVAGDKKEEGSTPPTSVPKEHVANGYAKFRQNAQKNGERNMLAQFLPDPCHLFGLGGAELTAASEEWNPPSPILGFAAQDFRRCRHGLSREAAETTPAGWYQVQPCHPVKAPTLLLWLHPFTPCTAGRLPCTPWQFDETGCCDISKVILLFLPVQPLSQVRKVEPSLLPRSQRVGSGRRLQACRLLGANSDIRAPATASMQLPCSAAQRTASICYRSAQGLHWHVLPQLCVVSSLQGPRGLRWDSDDNAAGLSTGLCLACLAAACYRGWITTKGTGCGGCYGVYERHHASSAGLTDTEVTASGSDACLEC